MKDSKMSWISILILMVLFLGFYFVTSIFLNNMKHDEEIKEEDPAVEEIDLNYTKETAIVSDLYQDVRMMYDVVNSKFKVDQDDIIIINDITYKRITNLDEVINGLFTVNGFNKYISDFKSYFAYTNDKYYLAGNLVSYQTYYFRGDNTNIYVLEANENSIDAIIYEKWTSNNKNTLATIKIVKENNEWLIENISILASQ